MSTGANMANPTPRSTISAELALVRGSENAQLSLANGWKWLRRHSKGLLARQASRRLRMVETLSLSEKRFVSIVEVDGEQFLLGGSASSVVLLAKLEGGAKEQKHVAVEETTFADVLSQASERAEVSAMNFKGPVEERGV
jgi:hypothetical protein